MIVHSHANRNAWDADPEPTVDQMRELLEIAESELRNLSIRLAERIQAVGYEDPCSYELADTILTSGRLVRRLRQQIALETAG